MGELLATASIVVCMAAQLLLGTGLNFLLCEKARSEDMFVWFAVDGLLLLFWLSCFWKYRTKVAWTELLGIPLLPFAYFLFVVICLTPRLIHYRSRFDQSDQESRHETETACPVGEGNVFYQLAENFESNSLVTVLTLSLTVMLIAFTLAGHAQHGLSSKYSLRLNTSAALFSVMDGLNLLQILFGALDIQDRHMINSIYGEETHCSNSTHRVAPPCVIDTLQALLEAGRNDQGMADDARLANESFWNITDLTNTEYHESMSGALGNFILFTAVCSFVMPVFALWQLKRESSKLKADEKLRKRAWSTVLRQATAGSLNVDEADGTDRRKKSLFKRGTIRFQTWKKKGKTMIRRMAKKRVQEEKKTYGKLRRDLKILDIISSMWDFFLVNLPGLIIRMTIWTTYHQSVSVLIVKNMLIVFFACLEFIVGYVQPVYRRMRGLHRKKSSGDIDVSDLRKYAMATDAEVMPMPVQTLSLRQYTGEPCMTYVSHGDADHDLEDLAPVPIVISHLKQMQHAEVADVSTPDAGNGSGNAGGGGRGSCVTFELPETQQEELEDDDIMLSEEYCDKEMTQYYLTEVLGHLGSTDV